MSDVFISYARPDRPKAERLADGFKAQGWSVWWNREIQLATEFRRRIADELTSARCVVVLWSKQLVCSDWVQDEASDGKEFPERAVESPSAVCPKPSGCINATKERPFVNSLGMRFVPSRE